MLTGYRLYLDEFDNYKVLQKHFDKQFPDSPRDFATILNEMKSLEDLEKHWVSKMYGVKDIFASREAGSGINKIGDIKNTPTMIFKAVNDPLIGPTSIDEERLT